MKFNSRKIFLTLVFVLTVTPFLYNSNKILPFSPKKFFFPSHPVIDFLKSDNELSRFYGIDTARFDTNFASFYKIYSPEGYGILRLGKYAQLVAASDTGNVPGSYPRADAIFPPAENNFRKRALDLLGVKYFLDKNDNETKSWNPETHRFPNDNVDLVWQDGKFKIYERKDALPRYFQTTDYIVSGDNDAIGKIYDSSFNLTTLLLEKSPDIPIENAQQFTVPELENYSPDFIKFKTEIPYASLLFLSDAYDSGWKSYIDGKKVKILRTDYALRSVAVPEGKHEVIFKYQPTSFTVGVAISTIALLALAVFLKFYKQKNN